MSTHNVTIVGPHNHQRDLFTILEANRQLRPIYIFATSGSSSAIQLILEDGPEVERFLETVWTHDPSAVEAVSITTHDSMMPIARASGSYAVHHPGATGWKSVMDALAPKPSTHVRALFAHTEPGQAHDLLTDISNHFVDVTGKGLSGSAATLREDGFISVSMDCPDDELSKILARLVSMRGEGVSINLMREVRITEEGRSAGVGILEFLQRDRARGQAN